MQWMGDICNRLDSYFDQHAEQLFVVKAVALVIILKLLESIFYLWWFTFLVLSPIFVFLILSVISIHQNKSAIQVIKENLTLIPAPYLDRDEKFPVIPWVTYSLVLINVLLFYVIVPNLYESTIDNLVFVPWDMTFINTLVSQITNIFLHADAWHLWGNMAFLWAFGAVLEKRLGHGWLFGLYFAAGFASNLLFLMADYFATGYLSVSLGASGAISGLMGVYAVRCYFKTMIFPLPVVGLFSIIIPISLKIRMNALVIIGLFFWADLSSGIDQAIGDNSDNVAYAAHLGGMLAGVWLAYGMNLGKEAVQEKHLDTARKAFRGNEWLGGEVGEKSIRQYLLNNDSDQEALLLLAQKVTLYGRPDEGRDLYEKIITIQLQTDIQEALSTYREYFNKYLRPLRSDLQMRMAVIAEREGDDNLATRSLELLLKEPSLPSEMREKCLFHCSRLCGKMGYVDASVMYQEQLADECSGSKS